MPASSAVAGPSQRGEPLQRTRRCHLLVPEASGATPERIAAYLAQVDRPMAALLARDRLERLGDGRYLYRSRPFQLLHLALVPTLELEACWQESALRVVSGRARLEGLGRWEEALTFRLAARLAAEPERGSEGDPGVSGEVEVALRLAPIVPGWGRALAGRALEQVLDRIERRLRRGLRQDLLTWLWDPGVSG